MAAMKISLTFLAVLMSALAVSTGVASAATRQYEGTVVSVNRDARTFRLHDSERGTIRIKVTRSTRFERISGFSGLRKGLKRVEATVRRSNGRWVATEVERSGGVATSGIAARIWRRADGSYAHHLLDPATGRPAWTGRVAATAVAESALEAEVLAKTALLSGPLVARRVLRPRGGVLQHDDGRVEVVPGPTVVRLPHPAAA